MDGSSSGGSNFSTISAVNDAPVAVADGVSPVYSTAAGQPLTILSAAGVLANDTETDSPLSSVKAVLGTGRAMEPSRWANDGSFTYTPDAGFSGTDTFTYRANDGRWGTTPDDVPMSPDSSDVTVSITVLDSTPPVVI